MPNGVPRTNLATKLTMMSLGVLAGLCLALTSNALEGVDYIKFEIKGITYDVPIPNKEARQSFYELQEVLGGNEAKRQFLLGGNDTKMIFIGDIGVVRWVKVTKNDISVIEYKQGERRDG